MDYDIIKHQYYEDGIVFMPNSVSQADLEPLSKWINTYFKSIRTESDGFSSIDNLDVQQQAEFLALAMHCQSLIINAEFTQLITNILQQNAYLYQFKVNMNPILSTTRYKWHQDYKYWHEIDGMMTPDAINLAVLLDIVDEYNGPTVFIPKTHKNSLVQHVDKTKVNNRNLDPNLPLPFILNEETLCEEMSENGLVSAKGSPGCLVLFHPSIFHCALNNITCFDRRVVFLTYVGEKVCFRHNDSPRPLLVANRNNILDFPVLRHIK